MFPEVFIKKNKFGALQSGHPWIFSGALETPTDSLAPGWVRVNSSKDPDVFFAYGYLNPRSQIAVRIVSQDPHQNPDQAIFWEQRLEQAYKYRLELGLVGKGRAFRLIHAEADGFPGLCVDVFDDVAVIQSNSAAGDAVKNFLLSDLVKTLKLKSVVEASTAAVRKLEGLAPVSEVLFGEKPGKMIIEEGQAKFEIDLEMGQKTGFYLDQRDSRLELEKISKGAHVLNAFSFTGAFGIHAALGGASSVLQIDSSRPAIEAARVNEVLNRPRFPSSCEFSYETRDVLKFLAEKPDPLYDLLILDPPKFVSKRGDLEAGLKRYSETFRLGFDLLKRRGGGRMLAFSCSQAVGWSELTRALFIAARKAKVSLVVEDHLQQSCDHPFLIEVPESFYLKGFLLKVGNHV